MSRLPQTDRSDRARLVLVLLALLVLSPTILEARGDDGGSAIAPALRGEFQIGQDGRLIVLPVQLENRQVQCLFDTGAGISSFDTRLKADLGPVRGTRLLNTPSGMTQGTEYDWPLARLGGQRLRTGQPVVALDLHELRDATNLEIFGVIGIDVLMNSRVRIDFDRGRLQFLERLPDRRESIGVAIPLRFPRPGPPFIEISLGADQTIPFLIDSGTQGNSLDAALFDDLLSQGRIRPGAGFSSVTAAGLTRGERGYVGTLGIGPFQVREQRVSRINVNSVGLRYLSRFVVTFDFPNAIMYLLPGEQFERPEPSATSGLTLLWKNGVPVVERVAHNGPAERAGIRKGDQLVRIDGSRQLSKDPFALRERMTQHPGQDVALVVLRGQRELNFCLTLERD